jgi:hypothetical protein
LTERKLDERARRVLAKRQVPEVRLTAEALAPTIALHVDPDLSGNHNLSRVGELLRLVS